MKHLEQIKLWGSIICGIAVVVGWVMIYAPLPKQQEALAEKHEEDVIKLEEADEEIEEETDELKDIFEDYILEQRIYRTEGNRREELMLELIKTNSEK